MRTTSKIIIFLAVLIVDLAFFIVLKQFFPEGYEWIITSVSFHTHTSLEVATSLFVIAGFVVVLICVPMILYLIYNTVKNAVKSI